MASRTENECLKVDADFMDTLYFLIFTSKPVYYVKIHYALFYENAC